MRQTLIRWKTPFDRRIVYIFFCLHGSFKRQLCLLHAVYTVHVVFVALYQQPVPLPETWVSDQFQNPSLPFHLDVGSAKGRFAEQLAELNPDVNVLGLEIRKPLADKCREERWRPTLTLVLALTLV